MKSLGPVNEGCEAGLQGIFNQLEERGQLTEQESQQLYSEAASKFLADRLVSGKCPKCGYEVRPRSSCTLPSSFHKTLWLVHKLKCRASHTCKFQPQSRWNCVQGGALHGKI